MAGADRIISLARHGETEWNRIGRWQGVTDIPLSDVGRAQARMLAQGLAGEGILRLYTSHLARARETAEIVAAALALPAAAVVVDARLRERGYGCFEGLTREECAVRYPGVWERYVLDRRAVPPDAEPHDEIVARVNAVMREIVAASAGDEPILVISHGGTIRTFVHAVTGEVLAPLGNGSVVRLRVAQADRYQLMSPEPVRDPDRLLPGA